MGVKILGVDTPLGSQAEVPFESDVELPFKYGPGGFYKPSGVPSLVGPAAGQQGTSLSTVPKGAYVNPSTGQPEMLTGPGGIAEKTSGGFNPLAMLAGLNPWARGAIAGAEIMRTTPAETGELTPAQMAHGPSDPADLLPKPAGYPQDYPASRLLDRPAGYPQDYPVSRLLDSPAAVVAAPAARGGGPRVTPAAAGPAAVAQQPNLGNYNPFTTIDRPNMSPQNSAYGHQGNVTGTALDLSRLFGGGAPAINPNAPAVAAQPVSATAPAKNTPYLDTKSGPMDPSIIARQKMKRPKSSSSSQGGGY